MNNGERLVVSDKRAPASRLPSRLFQNTSLTFVDDALFEIIRHQREGLPFRVVTVMARKLDMSVDAFITAISLPENIGKSRLMCGTNLSSLAAERVVRAARILKRAMDVFESELDARNWVTVANRALGGQSPLSYMDTGAGFYLVVDELKRIEYGLVA